MPTLNRIMCHDTTLCIVANPSVSGLAQVVINGFLNGTRFEFNFHSNDFQIMPVRFHPLVMGVSDAEKRDASIALVRDQAILNAFHKMNFNLAVEQDALILDGGSLHDLRRGMNGVHSPDRTSRPTEAVPADRRLLGYFHTHPFNPSMRPPTPASDWNEVPGVGFPGVGPVLHFMIEGSKRIWGLLHGRRAFIVGIVHDNRLYTVDRGTEAFNYCWELY